MTRGESLAKRLLFQKAQVDASFWQAIGCCYDDAMNELARANSPDEVEAMASRAADAYKRANAQRERAIVLARGVGG